MQQKQILLLISHKNKLYEIPYHILAADDEEYNIKFNMIRSK